jgi:hypothetical protein
VSCQGPFDPERILDALAEHEVEYVIVGASQCKHTDTCARRSIIDVFPKPERSNLARLAGALNALDARVLNPGDEGLAIDAAMLPRATMWQFATSHGAIDVLRDAPGAPSYANLRRRALEIRLGPKTIAVAGRDDLISMKRASARPVDLDDLAALTEPEPDS